MSQSLLTLFVRTSLCLPVCVCTLNISAGDSNTLLGYDALMLSENLVIHRELMPLTSGFTSWTAWILRTLAASFSKTSLGIDGSTNQKIPQAFSLHQH